MTCSETNAMKPVNSVCWTCERGGSRTGRWARREHWVGNGGPFPRKNSVDARFWAFVSLILARRRQVGINQTGSSAERLQQGVVDGHG